MILGSKNHPAWLSATPTTGYDRHARGNRINHTDWSSKFVNHSLTDVRCKPKSSPATLKAALVNTWTTLLPALAALSFSLFAFGLVLRPVQ